MIYEVSCPICGKAVGRLVRDGLTLRAEVVDCTERCRRLYKYGRHRNGWQDLPPDLRMLWLASGVLDYESRT